MWEVEKEVTIEENGRQGRRDQSEGTQQSKGALVERLTQAKRDEVRKKKPRVSGLSQEKALQQRRCKRARCPLPA